MTEERSRTRWRLGGHRAIVAGCILGLAAGGLLQLLETSTTLGFRASADPGGIPDPPGGLRVTAVAPGSPAASAGLRRDDFVLAAVLDRGTTGERRVELTGADSLEEVTAALDIGERAWLEVHRPAGGTRREVPVTATLAPDCARARWLAPLVFIADVFMSLLKMLIVPVILTSIVTGVARLKEGGNLGRLGLKTFAYYMATSLIAILIGLAFVNVIRPGAGVDIGLSPGRAEEFQEIPSLWEVFRRIVPPNVFESFADNGAMLQVIFFALLLGFVITKLPEPHAGRLADFFESLFHAMMAIAHLVLALLPVGVFALLAKVIGETGFSVIPPLLVYMLTVACGLAAHALLVLPAILYLVARVNPWRYMRAVSEALITAFFTSSSSITLPVTLRALEQRAGISNKVASFVAPLGATINMDGTALYECVGVMFLAQAYASLPGSDFTMTLGGQALVVVTALLASVGAAGIPSAGLVMMLTILSALGLPLEGAALLLAVDRPLDMLRTSVNIWSDTCAAAVISRAEGEGPPPGVAVRAARHAGGVPVLPP